MKMKEKGGRLRKETMWIKSFIRCPTLRAISITISVSIKHFKHIANIILYFHSQSFGSFSLALVKNEVVKTTMQQWLMSQP